MRGASFFVAVQAGVMLRRLSEDVQSSIQLHTGRLNAHPLQRPAAFSDDKFAAAAAAASASAMSPSSVTSGMTRDSVFSVDGSTIADDGRSTRSMSFHAAPDASAASLRPKPLTFGETAHAAGAQEQGRQHAAQACGSVHASTTAASATATQGLSARHRILEEIEGLMLALRSGGGRA